MAKKKVSQNAAIDELKDGILVKTSAGMQIKIFPIDILYLKAARDYTIIVTVHGEHLKPCQLGKLLEKLDNKTFLRVRHSYAVNADKIDGLKSGSVVVSGKQIHIGRKYKNALLKHRH